MDPQTCGFWITCLTGGLEAWTKSEVSPQPDGNATLPSAMRLTACPRRVAAETCPASRN